MRSAKASDVSYREGYRDPLDGLRFSMLLFLFFGGGLEFILDRYLSHKRIFSLV